MIEKIEAKIEEHINAILSKGVISRDDYLTLSSELSRLTWAQKEAKASADSEERTKMLVQSIADIYACSLR